MIKLFKSSLLLYIALVIAGFAMISAFGGKIITSESIWKKVFTKERNNFSKMPLKFQAHRSKKLIINSFSAGYIFTLTARKKREPHLNMLLKTAASWQARQVPGN